MNFRDSWNAQWEGDVLHISGITDRFPSDFSTASLRRLGESPARTLAYEITFNRDKEPFCDSNMVGPVHYFERAFPPVVVRISVSAPGDPDRAVFSVPPRAR